MVAKRVAETTAAVASSPWSIWVAIATAIAAPIVEKYTAPAVGHEAEGVMRVQYEVVASKIKEGQEAMLELAKQVRALEIQLAKLQVVTELTVQGKRIEALGASKGLDLPRPPGDLQGLRVFDGGAMDPVPAFEEVKARAIEQVKE
jgi:hypothetical protein